MDTVKSLRLPPDLLKAVRHRARRERLDESTAMRQLMAMGAVEYAVRLYRHGSLTLNQAAEVAGLSPREMLQALVDRGAAGNVTLEQQRKALSEVMKRVPR